MNEDPTGGRWALPLNFEIQSTTERQDHTGFISLLL